MYECSRVFAQGARITEHCDSCPGSVAISRELLELNTTHETNDQTAPNWRQKAPDLRSCAGPLGHVCMSASGGVAFGGAACGGDADEAMRVGGGDECLCTVELQLR